MVVWWKVVSDILLAKIIKVC